MGLDIAVISEICGYVSIACWLGAQFPQVFENIKRQSSDGLALPFLINWLLGDVSNLIGCILTHQLPFQTWLAIYFCSVDLTLFGQYFYYGYIKPSPSSIVQSRSRTTSAVRRTPVEPPASRYRTLSAAAANVAAAAAFAAQQDPHSKFQNPHRYRTSSVDQIFAQNGGHGSEDAAEIDDDVDDAVLSALADSFHSEGGRMTARKRVSWSQERRRGRGGSMGRNHLSPVVPTALRISSPQLDHEFLQRGRSLQRDMDTSVDHDLMAGDPTPRSASAQRGSSRASRRGASMIFLGVWTLFGIGTLVGNQQLSHSRRSLRVGRVSTANDVPVPIVSPVVIANSLSEESFNVFPSAVKLSFPPSDEISASHLSARAGEPFNERITGRIFAWLCTTLYLTSRLPQIWKNYDRKSVEGLSIYLFIFAFLGNFFYVSSILLSPEAHLPAPASTEFLKESIPYLLGSGGTLMFDVTIVSQSFIYRRRLPRRGRNSSVLSHTEEEEAGLLASDEFAENASHESVHDTAIASSKDRDSRSPGTVRP